MDARAGRRDDRRTRRATATERGRSVENPHLGTDRRAIEERAVIWPLAYLPEAEGEIAAIFHGYESEQPGLGGRFKASLRAALDNIAERPKSYALYWREVRTALINKFPHVV